MLGEVRAAALLSTCPPPPVSFLVSVGDAKSFAALFLRFLGWVGGWVRVGWVEVGSVNCRVRVGWVEMGSVNCPVRGGWVDGSSLGVGLVQYQGRILERILLSKLEYLL